jgi:hypothetical protein
MKKYEIKLRGDNIHVTRDFPELKRTIRRVVLNSSDWKSLVRWAKRDILREAQEVWGFPKKGGEK